MFKNYIKIGLRNLWKQKMPSTINIIGLSLAVGCCLVSFKWIESNLVRDRHHEHAYETYLVTPTRTIDGDQMRFGVTALHVADILENDVPGVEAVVRYTNGYGQIRVEEARFGNYYTYTEPSFFEVFSYPLIHGDKSALDDPRSVALSESNAKAFFGDEYPIGKEIGIEIAGEEKFFVVSAVFENAPRNSSMRPGVLLNILHLEDREDKLTTNAWTFILLDEEVAPESLQPQLAQIVEEKRELTPKSVYDDLSLEPLVTMARNSDQIASSFGGLPPMAPFILLTCIGLFMLLLSTFNYVNIATVMAMKRVKEIGVRKVIGGRRRQLITQFLIENLLLCTLAIVVGCLLASAFFLPWFNNISGGDLTLDLLGHQNLWWFLLILLVFITLVSGAYPAFYISSFKPVVIFRGGGAKNSKRRLTGSLLTFQMILAVITIMAGIMFVQTNRVNESRDWGYDQFSKLVVRVPFEQSYAALKAEIEKNPNVLEVSGSRTIIGQTFNSEKLIKGEEELYASFFYAEANYPKMMGMNLKAGTFFSEEARSQNQRSLIVNERFMRDLRLEFEEGLTIRKDSLTYNIIGVVEDFHYVSFSEVIRPAAFNVVPDSLLRNITIQVREGTTLAVSEELEASLETFDADNQYNFNRQDAIFDGHFREMNGIRNVMLFTATLSMLLSAMGLFGLVSLSISSRIKDFGIKKVLGANFLQLSKDVYKRFALILGIAIVIGGTLSVFIIGVLLDEVYGYHEEIGIVPMSLAGLVLLTVAALTINTQVRQVKRMNPAETLRTE